MTIRDRNLLKNKSIVAVFAHPDDEAMGPAGTLAKLAKENDVYVICATGGEAGQSAIKHKNLGVARKNELQNSARILGIKQVFYLNFIDGTLNNAVYHKLADEIEKILKQLKPEILITFEPRGISGHIDHIAVSLVTTYVFYKLKFVHKLFYYCLSEKQRSEFGDYFIYVPPGYKDNEIDMKVDISKFWNTKVAAIMAHKSQIADAKKILSVAEKLPKEEYFMVLRKSFSGLILSSLF